MDFWDGLLTDQKEHLQIVVYWNEGAMFDWIHIIWESGQALVLQHKPQIVRILFKAENYHPKYHWIVTTALRCEGGKMRQNKFGH